MCSYETKTLEVQKGCKSDRLTYRLCDHHQIQTRQQWVSPEDAEWLMSCSSYRNGSLDKCHSERDLTQEISYWRLKERTGNAEVKQMWGTRARSCHSQVLGDRWEEVHVTRTLDFKEGVPMADPRTFKTNVRVLVHSRRDSSGGQRNCCWET